MLRLGVDSGLATGKNLTGVGHYASSLLTALDGLAPSMDTSVTTYLPPATRLESTRSLVPRNRPFPSTRLRSLWMTYRSWLDRLEIFYTFGIEIPRFARGLRIITLYDLIFCEFPDCYPPGVASQLETQLRRASSHIDAIVVCSGATESAARKYLGLQVPAIVTLAAPRSCFRPGPRKAPEEILAGLQGPYFLFVGRVDKRKNAHALVEAYRQVLQQDLPCSLVIAGPPDSGSSLLTDLLGESQIPGENIIVPGYLDESVLLDLYRSALAFVFPTFNEGFGMPVLEAMACGSPVITSNIAVMREILPAEAMFVDPASVAELTAAMRSLLVDPALASRLSHQGLVHVQKYTWQECGKRFLHGMKDTITTVSRK